MWLQAIVLSAVDITSATDTQTDTQLGLGGLDSPWLSLALPGRHQINHFIIVTQEEPGLSVGIHCWSGLIQHSDNINRTQSNHGQLKLD